MLKFTEYLVEATINDFVGGKKDSETERHRSQYYDDSHLDAPFHKIGGRYVLAKDRKDIHPDFQKDKEVKLDRIALMKDSFGKMRYHGIVGDKSIPMSNFQKPKLLMKRRGDTLNVENTQINSIHSQIQKEIEKNGGKPIRMKMPNGEINEVAGIKAASELTGGKNTKAKADAYLHDKNGNPLHFMSLKGDTYQQWGGYKDLDEHPVIQHAISKFKELKNKLAPNENFLPANSVYHYDLDSKNPEHRALIAKAMYGKNHGQEYGIHNVHAIYGGNTTTLKPSEDGIFQLHTNAIHTNSNDENTPVANAKIMLHKSSGHNQAGTGGRVTIQDTGNVQSSTSINNGVDEAIKTRMQPKQKIVRSPAQKATNQQKQPSSITTQENSRLADDRGPSGDYAGHSYHGPGEKEQ
jgi:hypothetical protein